MAFEIPNARTLAQEARIISRARTFRTQGLRLLQSLF